MEINLNLNLMMMISPFNSLHEPGRANPRPMDIQSELESLDIDQQSELVERYADADCADCHGFGGTIETDDIDRGHYTLVKEYIQVCECVYKSHTHQNASICHCP